MSVIITSYKIIIAKDITTDANDIQQLEAMLEESEEVNGKRPEKALADAGHWRLAYATLEDEQTELFIATTKDWNAHLDKPYHQF